MAPRYCVLDEALLSYRRVGAGERCAATLPELFEAMARDEVRDFPALRPHQRHPWHAFLVQAAALALHGAGRQQPFDTSGEWRAALLALTPDHPDGSAWSLVAPLDQPALMQPPVPEGTVKGWKRVATPDAVDMLVTSRNHDLKGERMRKAQPEEWLLGLISLQTQEGFLGAGNYGISRMNGGFASRPGVGVVPPGNWGRRWQRDVNVLLEKRESIAATEGMLQSGGHALVWLVPWDGASSLGFGSLDPFYIEICRRLRLTESGSDLVALAIGSKVARIQAKERTGRTGDAWSPVVIDGGKALTITRDGFDYKRMSELLFDQHKYRAPIAQKVYRNDGRQDLQVLAQGITRGQGKTEGYHERRVPISPKTARFLSSGEIDIPAKLAAARIDAIGELRKLLWGALCVLLRNGDGKEALDPQKDRAGFYAKQFEHAEDARFFDDLAEAIEAEDDERSAVFSSWLLACFNRAEGTLRRAFPAVPRSGIQRYRAQAAALRYLYGRAQSPKFPLQQLRDLLTSQSAPIPTESPDVIP